VLDNNNVFFSMSLIGYIWFNLVFIDIVILAAIYKKCTMYFIVSLSHIHLLVLNCN